jgi:hypothetical protein
VEVIAGANEGQIGYVSNATEAMVQVTTGDDKIFAARKTSVRIIANPVAVGRVPGRDGKVDFLRVKQLIDRVGNVIDNNDITVEQWQNINLMVHELFEN